MILDVSLDNDSITIPIENPFHLDMDSLMARIEGFAASKEARINGIDIRGLIPQMIRGIAGCERGCPADAKSLTERGSKQFELKYIEGGILSARANIEDGKFLHLKIFPEF
jgi:hypothetical protein